VRQTPDRAGAKSGDLVRARTAERDSIAIEGTLQLVYVAVWNYVQVNVVEDDDAIAVDPSSIEVLKRSAVPATPPGDAAAVEVDAGQGLFCNLDEAKAAGLVPPARDYGGVTWSDLFARSP
jgi:hypothetical protein